MPEALGVLATLIKIDARQEDIDWYTRIWAFASEYFMDADRGGWFPEIDGDNNHTTTQFAGKPDIYHALQAVMFPLSPNVSNIATTLPNLDEVAA